jgi:Icc protein
MSRRSFLKRLLLVAASLIGFSAAFAWWLKKTILPEKTDVAVTPADSINASPEAAPADGVNEPLFSYFILSDLHITMGEASTTTAKMKLVMEDLKSFKEGKVEAIVLTGDLTDSGITEEYKILRNILDSYKLPPVHANMGNHDYYTIWINKNNAWDQESKPNGKSDAISREQFMKFFGYEKPYNEFSINGQTVLLLSQEAYVQEKPEVGEGAWYSDEQLAWLKERLAAVYQPGKPIFVMTHQPLPATGTDGRSHQLIRAKEFREILKPYKNVFVFCGHRHQDFQNGSQHYFKESFHYFHNSSVGRPSNRNFQPSAQGGKSQGLYVQVYKNKVVLRGREFSDRTFIAEADWTVELDPV